MENNQSISLEQRKFPYPYRAMMAICSDLDETPDKTVYFGIAEYLNTDRETIYGRGVNLEVGNTIYFDMPKDQFSYWNTDDDGRDKIVALIKSGHIDALHSFGDYAKSRNNVVRNLEALNANDCKIEVWIDHAIAPSNLGADIMQGRGDLRESEVYHTDLSVAYGIKYVWTGRVTSVIGQDVKRRYRGIYEPLQPMRSIKTILKEVVKVLLSVVGSSKYALHRNNVLIQKTALRDGSQVYEFMRSNPFWGGVSESETLYGLKHVLTLRYLEQLVRVGGYSILYTHLGKIDSVEKPFDHETRNALTVLERFFSNKQILVTTTQRLLRYRMLSEDVGINARLEDGVLKIALESNREVDQLEGLTLYLPSAIDEVELTHNGQLVDDHSINPPDETGRASLSLGWKRLTYPI